MIRIIKDQDTETIFLLDIRNFARSVGFNPRTIRAEFLEVPIICK